MELLTPLVAGVLLALFTMIQTWINKGRFDVLAGQIRELKGDVREFRQEVKADIAEVRAEVKADIAELRAEVKADINALRSDLTLVALAVGAQPRPQAG